MHEEAHITLRVEARVVGTRKPGHAPWHVALPPTLLQEVAGAEQIVLLRHLIAYIVREEVRAFELRQEERSLLRVLQPQEIVDAASTGKIAMGGMQAQEPVDVEAAQERALLGFRDGIYLVFLDGQRQHDLEAPVQLSPESVLLFIRLVALVGG